MENKLELIKKSLTYVLAALVLVGVAYFYANQPKSNVETTNSGTPASSSATGFGQLLGGDSFSYNGEEGKTAIVLLNAQAKVEMTGEGEMAYVTAINGRKADSAKKEYWGFFVNGYPSEVGAGSYNTKSTDKIEWKIATY